MKNEILRKLMNRLMLIEPDESPLISCFVDVDRPRAEYEHELAYDAGLVSKRLTGERRAHFDYALSEIRDYLDRGLKPGTKSVAIYVRWGDSPVFLAMDFEVPLKQMFIVDSIPHIYPLIELKDTYHRFVIVITTETEARILETTVGSVTESVLTERPELRQRIGREWTRQHYQSHKREREQQFIREKIRIIGELMSRRGHNQLVIAGSPRMANRLSNALPSSMKKKVISVVTTNPKNGIGPILLESIRLFAAAENIESHDHVQLLESAVLGGGLGVAGYDDCLQALAGGYADMLIIDQDFEIPEQREELVRLATLHGIPIETVNRSETLQRLAGVGCLLRYRPHPSDEEQQRISA